MRKYNTASPFPPIWASIWASIWTACSSGLLRALCIVVLLNSYSDRSWSQGEQSIVTAQGLPQELAETLSQAKEDLLSESVQRRVSAAILLGKYTYPQSQQLLLTTLDDASPAVRRAAVVSLREHAQFRNITDIEKFLAKLGDKDVEVRRTVSSILGNLGRQLNNFSITAQPSGQQYTLPPDLKMTVTSAFSDEDDIVRLNIARSFFRLNIVLSSDIAVSLLEDSYTETVIATLKILKTIPLTDNIADKIERLSKSKDYYIQVALVENLIDSNDERIITLLMQLTDSDKPYFRFTHYILKVRHGAEITKNELEDVAKLLSTFKKSTDLLEKLIKDVHLFQSESVNLVLIQHSLLNFRLPGWEMLLKKKGLSEIESSLLLQGLSDTSLRVRQTIINFLLQSPDQVSSRLIESMISSSIPDIRIGAAELLIRMSVAPTSDLVLSLLVDEDPQVRASAVRVIIKHRPPNWKKILQRSLRDRDFSVQKQSVSQLFGIGQEGIRMLQTYAQENSQTAIAQHINAEFIRRKIQPVPITNLKTTVTNKE